MSTTPQMSQMGQQQGQHSQQIQPTTAPPQQFGHQQGIGQQQPFGQQMQQPSGWPGVGLLPQMQQPFGPQGIGQQQTPQQVSQQIPQHLQQQLHQLGQQQPFQQLLQQLGQRQQEIPQAQAPQVSTQAVASNVATSFWDVVQPLPGQSSILYLFVDNAWRALVNPNQPTHDEVQEAFAYGQKVIGYYDTNNPAYLLAIVVTR